ncbi:hypothetical protein V6Z90_009902 [Aspergillus fumigatus]
MGKGSHRTIGDCFQATGDTRPAHGTFVSACALCRDPRPAIHWMSLIRSQYPVLFDHAGICAADPIFHGDVAGKRQEAFDSQRDIVTGDSKMKTCARGFWMSEGPSRRLESNGELRQGYRGVHLGWLAQVEKCMCLLGRESRHVGGPWVNAVISRLRTAMTDVPTINSMLN